MHGQTYIKLEVIHKLVPFHMIQRLNRHLQRDLSTTEYIIPIHESLVYGIKVLKLQNV